MRVWAAICNIIGVFLILYWMLICELQYNTFEKDYDTAVLKIATDYASMAAIDTAMVNSETIGTDYLSIDNVTITSGKVLDIFCEVMCMCYNMPASDLNKKIIEDAIAGAVICTNDGYFEGLPTAEGLNFVVKKPYTINLKDYMGVNSTVAVKLNGDSGIVVKNQGDGISSAYADLSILNNILYTYGQAAIDTEEFKRLKQILVAVKINNALTYSAERINAYRTDRDYRIYIPAYGTDGGINSVKGPTLIMLMRGSDFSGKAESTNITMSGYEITEILYVIGFEEDGVKYYCYEDKIPEKYIGLDTTYYFDDVYEAAMKGYIPHLGYLTN